MSGLTPRQEMFCRAYVANGRNATKAAIDSGYSAKTAQVQSSRLLSNVMVQAKIQELQQPIFDELNVTAERVIRTLAAKAFFNPGDLVKWGPRGVNPVDSETLTADQKLAVSAIGQTVTQGGGSIRVKFADSIRALELLGKRLGLWDGDDKVQQAAAGSAEGMMKAVSELSDEELQKLASLRPTHAK